MKKNSFFWNRYFWWPVVSAVNWIGEFTNLRPLKVKRGRPSVKIMQDRKKVHKSTEPKGAPHAETKVFNHPRK